MNNVLVIRSMKRSMHLDFVVDKAASVKKPSWQAFLRMHPALHTKRTTMVCDCFGATMPYYETIALGTISSFETFIGLWRFFTLLGATSSMFMLMDEPPSPCPSIEADMLRLYLVYKTSTKDEPLVDARGRHIKDGFGRLVYCAGGWNAPVNIEHLFTFIRGLHEFYGQAGGYQDACPECQAGVIDNPDFPGCRFHHNNRKLLRSVRRQSWDWIGEGDIWKIYYVVIHRATPNSKAHSRE